MIKLTQQQIAVLASAATQPDGFAARPADMKPGALAKLAAKLIEHGLVRELRAKGDAPVWREDEDGQRFSLKLLKAGRALVAVPGNAASTFHKAPDREPTCNEPVAAPSGIEAASAVASRHPTKRTLILGLMGRDSGATLDDLVAATGWLPHTTRAALTGLRKSGVILDRRRDDASGSSVYKIASAPTAEAS